MSPLGWWRDAPWKLVAGREIHQRMRSKAFVISSVLLVVFAVLGVVVSSLVRDDRTARVRVVLVEATSQSAEVPRVGAMRTVLPEIGRALDREVITTTRATRDDAVAALRAGEADVAIDATTAVWRSDIDDIEQALVRAAMQTVVRDQRAAALGLDAAQVAGIFAPVELTSDTIDPRDPDADIRAATAAAGLVLLFLAVQIHGAAVLMGVVEEKSSRIVEVVLGHVRPRMLLAGKVAGIGAVGLVQVVLVAGAALISTFAVRSLDAPDVPAPAIVWFVVWFVLGFTLYATVFAGLGSLVSRQEDAQSVVTPATIPLLASYFVGFAAVANPDSLLARLTSYFPFSAPMVMPVRIAAGSPEAWEVVVALALVTLTIVLVLRLAAVVYEGNVLRTGSRASLTTAWRTIRRPR